MSEIFPPPFPVDGDVLFVFDGNGYITPSWDTDANAWNFDPVLPPGRGCRYVRYPPTASLTFSGNIHTPVLPLSITRWRPVCRQVPAKATFESITGYLPDPSGTDLVQLLRWSSSAPFHWSLYLYQNGKWAPEPPVMEIGEAVFIDPGTNMLLLAAFAVSAVNPTRVCGSAPFTIKVFGAGFPVVPTNNPMAVVKLRSAGGGPEIAADTVTTDDPDNDVGYQLAVAYTNPSIPAGLYDVIVQDPNNSANRAVLTAGLAVGGNSPDLTVEPFGPPVLANHLPRRYSIFYANNGCAPQNSAFNIDVITIPNSIPSQLQVTSSSQSYVSIPAGIRFTIPSLAVGSQGYIFFDLTPNTAQTLPYNVTLEVSNSLNSSSSYLPLQVLSSQDPNGKAGVPGFGPSRSITGRGALDYEIHFENAASAAAPVQDVTITDTLDASTMDLGSLSLGPITFGTNTLTPPPGSTNFSADVPYEVDGDSGTTNDDIIVRINASLTYSAQFYDYVYAYTPKAVATWTFRSIDPSTGQRPTDPMRGFLPPNTSPPNGQGSLLFTVNPYRNLSLGQPITNQASIVFGTNTAILTPIWTNTVDDRVPRLQVRRAGTSATITWTGVGVLQTAPDLTGSWQDLPAALSPYTNAIGPQTFFRVRQ